MKTTNNYKQVIKAAETVNEMDAKLNKDEAKRLIDQAIKESRHYTDIKIRETNRQARREEKMIRKSQMTASISIVLFVASLLVIYACESTLKSPGFNENSPLFGLVVIISTIILGCSFGLLIMASKIPEEFYKVEYTIYYKKGLDFNGYVDYAEYHTKSTSATKAITRFYKITDLKYEPYKVEDEFGTLYENDGKISRRNYD